jgi:hypothetical protein
MMTHKEIEAIERCTMHHAHIVVEHQTSSKDIEDRLDPLKDEQLESTTSVVNDFFSQNNFEKIRTSKDFTHSREGSYAARS